MRALSIRQPYAELILRGIKPIEFRSRATTIIGERFYIYASKRWAVGKLFLEGCGIPERRTQSAELRAKSEERAWSHDLAMPREGPEPWMLELARMLILKDLPTGVIVGSAVIERVERVEDGRLKMEDGAGEPSASSIVQPPSSLFRWHLADVERVARLRKPTGHPQPVWFNPFR